MWDGGYIMDLELLKELYGEAETLSADDLIKAINEKGLKLADLATGGYVSKDKHESELSAYKKQIGEYDAKLKTFEDLKPDELKEQVEALANAKTELEAKLSAQEYSHRLEAVISAEKFSSNAAKQHFIAELKAKALSFDGDTLLGYADFKSAYEETDPGAFAAAPADDSKPAIMKNLNSKKEIAMTRAEFDKLTTSEQLAIKANDPELFTKLLRKK